MNQDQVKQLLLTLRSDVEEFFVIFSGKKSKKVNGLYKPDTREIIIHNKNMENDNAIIYTAIHEFAHHIQFTQTHSPLSARYHTVHFWDIFHSILFQAEKQGLYRNIFENDPEFQELTDRIKQDFLTVHGSLIQELGKVLIKAFELCNKHHVDFNDYVNRVLKIRHTNARFFIKLSQMNIDPEVGYENMKALSSIKDPAQRKQAESALKKDHSPDMLRARFISKTKELNPVELLLSEKQRIEKTIASLTARLRVVKERLGELKDTHGSS
ncbi:MAG: hypothetical protein JW822_10275 [Spirochaetales bacterium]|nr:hypothetical protein [Spirochaetales bacterium]